MFQKNEFPGFFSSLEQINNKICTNPLSSKKFIHIWKLPDSLSITHKEFCDIYSLLPTSEIQMANQFRCSLRFFRFVYVRGFLRKILSKYLSTSPLEIQFFRGSYGKPFLAFPNENNFNFNLSHSNHLDLIAISTFGQIGLDIEFVSKQHRHHDQIISKFFTRNEQNEYFSVSKNMKTQSFYSGWTRKEAFIKALGLSLPLASHSCEVSMSPQKNTEPSNDSLTEKIDSNNQFACIDFTPEKGFFGAFIVDGTKSFFSRNSIPFSHVQFLNSH